MERSHLSCLLAFFTALGALGFTACSGGGAGCKFDVDCPGTQRCVDGACKYPDPVGPCEGVNCQPGEFCVDGTCIDADTDADGDGWNVMGDCDDQDPAINPDATEVCNERDDDCDGATDEDLFCGEDCLPTDQPPATDPPATCDDETPCATCYVYDSTIYFCRRLGAAEPAWVAIPQMTPCGPAQHCALMSCQGDRFFHCDADLESYVDGNVPTADREDCNGLDDNCDGQTDEAGAESSCPPRDKASATCQAGACQYACEPGYHACGDACLDDTSPNSCGQRCVPCLPPDNADATCQAGTCGFTCQPGNLEQANACVPCDTDLACGLDCTPCGPGTTCCQDACYDLANDPDHCKGCDQSCPEATDTCCTDGCCPQTHPQCCDQYCCQDQDQCCQGNPRYCCEAGGNCCTDHCCPAANATCCGDGCCQTDATCCGDGCCPSGTDCCNGVACCNPDSTCCADGCCPAGSGVCCGAGCCPDGTNCCNSQYCCDPGTTCCPTGCCPAGYPVCCGDLCCPAGTSCCNNQTACCNLKTGLPIEHGELATPKPQPSLQAPPGRPTR